MSKEWISKEKLKKWSTFGCMTLLFLAGGIEYSVILPTLWDYMHSMGGGDALYGLAIAGYSISELITSPIYGLVYDKMQHFSWILLVANGFEIGGNLVYFCARSKYMIVASRFLAGLGAGVGAAMYGELARITNRDNRTSVFSFFMGMRQLGLVIGPALDLFLGVFNFKIGPFVMDRLTSPGGFMTLAWIFLEVIFLLFFFTLPSSEAEKDLNEAKIATNGVNRKRKEATEIQCHSSTEESSREEDSLGLDGMERVLLQGKEKPPDHVPKRNIFMRVIWLFGSRAWGLVKEEFVVLLFTIFVALFNQNALETMFIPLDERLLEWGEQTISISFSVAGVLMIFVSFVAVIGLSRFIPDRYLAYTGILIELFSYSWLLISVGQATSRFGLGVQKLIVALGSIMGPLWAGTPWITERMMVAFYTAIFGMPFITVIPASMYSKILPARIQGFGLGVQRSVVALGSIMGPLWAGGAIVFPNYYILFCVPCALLLITLVLATISFSRLNVQAVIF